jgi:hypothetical protein
LVERRWMSQQVCNTRDEFRDVANDAIAATKVA